MPRGAYIYNTLTEFIRVGLSCFLYSLIYSMLARMWFVFPFKGNVAEVSNRDVSFVTSTERASCPPKKTSIKYSLCLCQYIIMYVMHIQSQNKQVLSQTRAKHDLNKWTACAHQHSNSHFLEWLVRPQLNIQSLATWERMKEVSRSVKKMFVCFLGKTLSFNIIYHTFNMATWN